jgi:2-succinyl-5-enolpyruvyl-6-hydroxy-3-cyclohexene-1-carboxylate synthase
MLYQPIYDIAEICYRKSIRDVILCPGSRCAPLTLAFTRHPHIRTRTVSDERSAGFIALGLAQALQAPVAIVCTSGTAAYNLAPAIAEAFFSNTPLIVLTADRPAEWIAQHDGQTIYQRELYGRHVKHYYELPQEYEHPDSVWAINRIINDAINLSIAGPQGPVHINAPFREPLYPPKGEDVFQYSDVRVIDATPHDVVLSNEVLTMVSDEWKSYHNVLIVAGQQPPQNDLVTSLSRFRQKHPVPLVHDVISNLHGVGDTVAHSDLFLGQAPPNVKEMLRPDLLITFGNSLISKNLKLFLRKYRPQRHWHIQDCGPVADTFGSLTNIIRTTPHQFIQFLETLDVADNFEGQKQKNYQSLWEAEERRALRALEDLFAASTDLSELGLVKKLMTYLPAGSNLHLANSMSVRYANFVGLGASQSEVRVFSNRGTSGIDGSNSTAVGHALASDKPNFLVTGDLAFFYDRNAFWHNYPLQNLRILLLNNHGGLIFDILDGPSSTPEADEYFITRQKLSGKKMCEEFGFDHLKVDTTKKIKNLMKDFLTFDGTAKVMELESDTKTNRRIIEDLREKIKNSYEL